MEKKTLDYLSLSEMFFNNYHTAIAILDRDFNFIRVNELYAKADNRPVTDFPGHNHFEFYPGDEVKSIFENVVRTKETYQIFARPFVYSNNPERGITYWDWTLVPVLDDTGEVKILIFTLINVTEQKRKEIELERFFELSHDLLCVVDYNFVVKRVNQAFKNILGYSKSEIVGTKGTDYVHPEDIGASLREFDKLFNINIPMINYVNRFRCKDGSYKWIEWINTPNPQEQLFYTVGRDISERIKTQREMARLDRLNLIGQMAAGIGHEVRNPMTVVRGFLQILSNKPKYIDDNEYFNIIISELDRTNSIITKFLSLSRNKQVELRPHNFNHIIEDLFPLLQTDALNVDKNIEIKKQPVPDIKIDKSEICQLILNLVRNGLDATQKGGCVTIKTFVDGEDAVLAIKDEGNGIDPSILDKLGTPFLTTKAEGTGLGLATCYSIADRHNAKIDVDTSSEGTTFFTRFKITG